MQHWLGRLCAATPNTARRSQDSIRRQLPAGPPIPRLSRVGGFTFPEDPAKSCAAVRPVWSADLDPRVLVVIARSIKPDTRSQCFNLGRYSARVLRNASCEHILIEHLDTWIRMDVVSGTLCNGPVSLCFQVTERQNLLAQIEALRAFHALTRGRAERAPGRARIARPLVGLQALDARKAGHSLRAISKVLLGSDWPGDGEHKKSRVRRLVASGEALVRAGHAAIFR